VGLEAAILVRSRNSAIAELILKPENGEGLQLLYRSNASNKEGSGAPCRKFFRKSNDKDDFVGMSNDMVG